MKSKRNLIFGGAFLLAAGTYVTWNGASLNDKTTVSLPQSAADQNNVKASSSTADVAPVMPSGSLAKLRAREIQGIAFSKEPLDLGTGQNLDLALDRLFVPGTDGDPYVTFPACNSVAELEAKLVELRQETGKEPMMVAFRSGNLRLPETRYKLTPFVLAKTTDKEATIAAASKLGLKFSHKALAHNDYLVFEANDRSPISAISAMKELRSEPSVAGVELDMGKHYEKAALVNDPLLSEQWHLKNTGQGNSVPGVDVNVEEAWDIATGVGVTIGIVDDGIQHNHPDLAPNMGEFHMDMLESDFDFDPLTGELTDDSIIDNDTSPKDTELDDNHGTAVSGVAAARGNNSKGVSGAAPYASISSVRIGFDDRFSLTNQMAGLAESWEAERTHIKSNSWGSQTIYWFTDDAGIFMDSIAEGGITGRDGLGTIYVKSAGNARGNGNQSIKQGWINSPYLIPVIASGNRGGHTYYSDFGPHCVISAPSGNASANDITTTDRTGALGYNTGAVAGDLSNADYTNSFSGTSSACPLVSGCVALMLQANPNLNVRDVKEILMRSANRPDIDPRGWVLRPGFRTDLPPIKHHHDYGGGNINAGAAVKMARDWLPLGDEMLAVTKTDTARSAFPFAGTITKTFNLTLDPGVRVEHVYLEFPMVVDTNDWDGDNNRTELVSGLRYRYMPDMEIEITAPDGTVSLIHYGDLANVGEQIGPIDDGPPAGFYFTTVRHWGSDSRGTWKVRVADVASNYYLVPVPNAEPRVVDLGMALDSIRLRVEGTPLPTNSTRTIAISSTINNDFGSQLVGNDYTRTFSITNTGGMDFVVANVAFTGDQVFTGNFSGVVAAGATRSFDVTFSPEAATNYETTMLVNSTADTGTSFVVLTGTGLESPPPVLTPPANLTVRSSSEISIPVVSDYAVTFTATGLPRGLVIDPKTGQITGTSAVTGTHEVTVTATNPWGSSSATFTLVIDPLVTTLLGDYTAVISRSSEINDDAGGLLQLKVSANGSYSGSLMMNTERITMKGFINGPSTGNPILTQIIQAKKGPKYLVTVEFFPDQTISGDITYGELVAPVEADIAGWRNSWLSTSSFANAGIFNHRLSVAAGFVGDQTVPQGHGFISQNIAANGKARTQGMTADGQKFTSLSDIGFGGQFAVWSMVHKNNGVIQASGTITGTTAVGTGYSRKYLYEPVAARMYRSGYGLLDTLSLVTTGGLYTPPTSTTAHLGKVPGASNAVITFSQGGVAASATNATTSISLGAGGSVAVPAAGSAQNPAFVSLKVNAKTGMVTGSMVLTDANRLEPGTFYKRKVSFSGVIDSSTNAAYGYFHLNQLPPTSGLPIPLNKTSILSGAWILQ